MFFFLLLEAEQDHGDVQTAHIFLVEAEHDHFSEAHSHVALEYSETKT